MALAGPGLGAVFGELLRAAIETKNVAVGFSSILNRLQVTIESVIPRIREIDEWKKEVDYGKEELEGVMEELKKGVDLVRKCSKVTRLNLYKRTKYTTKLQELDDFIIRFFKIHSAKKRNPEADTLSEKSDEERVGGVGAKLENSSNLSDDSETDAEFRSFYQSVPASLQKEEKGVLPMLGKVFMPRKGSEKAEMTEPSINRLEEGHPSVMQHHLGMIEPPNDGQFVKGKSRLVLMQAGLGLTVPPKEEEWEEAEEIHLMDNELSELPERPMCSILSKLYLQGNYKLRKIPSSFFEHMPALQVLNLSKTGIRSLPESLFRLVGLKKLFLNGCENFMMLSPKVGELKCLEVLNLEGTEIIDLPKEVEKLTNLKCLKVSFYGYINHGRKKEQSNAMIHGGVILALSKLEELNIDVNPDDERWGISVEAIFDEICSLMQLRTLKFYFPGVELLRQFRWFPVQPSLSCFRFIVLSHFRFIVGHHSKRIISRLPQDAEFELKNWDRCLTYIYGEGVPGEIKKVLQYATAFHLDRHTTVKRLSEFGIENMEQLKCCIVGECKEIQVIIDGGDVHEEYHNREIVPESSSDKRIGLEALEYLNIYYMKNLRSIWKGPVHGKCLSLLKSLTLRTCPELTTIFTLFFLDNFDSLEELKIEDCRALKSLVSCENHSKPESSSSTRDYFLPKLKKISLYYVPELASISNDVFIAPKLEWLAFYNCPSLKSLSIEEVCSTYLEMIIGEKDWWDALEWRNGRPDNLDGIFVPINADDLTNTMDNCHSSFLSPSHALKQKWSPSQQQGQDKERMSNAGNKGEGMGKEMKQQKPPVRVNIETGFSVSTGGTDLSSVTSKASYSVGTGRTDLSSMTSKASSFSVPSSEGEILPSINVKSFSLAELRMATRNFRPDNLLGEGGFGFVFKGWIDEHSFTSAKPGTGMAIAVKVLNIESFQGHREWLAEVKYLGQLYHPHLVKLIGYCLEDENRLLVYEFMPRGSLEYHLFRRGSNFQPLSWDLRLKVALGAAKGLAFLHSAETQVIYRDFKTSNILLDSNYNAKLSDFGLAKDGPTGDKSHVSTRVRGTSGYIDPEYSATGHLTSKSDVYGFGVVLLEMLSGRRVVDKSRPSGEHSLVNWAKPYLIQEQKIFRVMDSCLEGQYKLDGALKVANLALRCLSRESKFRPNMDEVVTALEELQNPKEA